MTRFVVIATPRSGSTWVIDTLNNHPHVVAYGELFLPRGDGTPPFGRRDLPYFSSYASERGARGPLGRLSLRTQYLDVLFGASSAENVIGCKLMYSQAIQNPTLFPHFIRKRVRLIHLVRRNALDVILSRATADARGMYHAEADDAIQAVAVELDASRLVRIFTHKERAMSSMRFLLSHMTLPYLEIQYEEIAADASTFQKVFGFLGVDPSRGGPTSSLRKLNTTPRSELIANYPAVERALEGTRFAWMLRSH
jgi:LPS sulfotransferase NodH